MLTHKNTNEICQSGIIGMKWGRRRFQNIDGSLTEEGKKRYGKDSGSDSSNKKSEENKQTKSNKSGSSETNEKKTSNSKVDVSTLSDKELNDRINRIRNEQTYKDLTANPVLKWGKTIAKTVVTNVATKYVTDLTYNGLDPIINNIKSKFGTGKINALKNKLDNLNNNLSNPNKPSKSNNNPSNTTKSNNSNKNPNEPSESNSKTPEEYVNTYITSNSKKAGRPSKTDIIYDQAYGEGSSRYNTSTTSYTIVNNGKEYVTEKMSNGTVRYENKNTGNVFFKKNGKKISR